MIGLVTVLYKSESVLEGFLSSLSKQTFTDYHLFLIDNSPTQEGSAIITKLCDDYKISSVTHVQNQDNVGVAKGNNQGIHLSLESGCSHTVLLNNDIEFNQKFLLQEMYEYAIKHEESFIIPKILYFDTGKIWMAGGNLLKKKGIVYHIGDRKTDSPSYDKPGYFDYAPTCFMLINNQVFSSVGMMDEKYFVYYDDTDFVFRAHQKGYKIFYLPSLRVYHKVSSSTGGGKSLVAIYFNTRNRIYFIRKNLKTNERFIPLFYTVVTRLIRWFLYDKRQRKELIKALRDGFQMKLN